MTIGRNVSWADKVATSIMRHFDRDDDNEIDIAEFADEAPAATSPEGKSSPFAEALTDMSLAQRRRLFQKIDVSGDGRISHDELRRYIIKMDYGK